MKRSSSAETKKAKTVKFGPPLVARSTSRTVGSPGRARVVVERERRDEDEGQHGDDADDPEGAAPSELAAQLGPPGQGPAHRARTCRRRSTSEVSADVVVGPGPARTR